MAGYEVTSTIEALSSEGAAYRVAPILFRIWSLDIVGLQEELLHLDRRFRKLSDKTALVDVSIVRINHQHHFFTVASPET